MEYSNDVFLEYVNKYIHSERNRKILIRRYIDGIRFEQLAEEFDLTPRQVSRIVHKYGDKILTLID